MHAIVLPGNSKEHNEDWANKLPEKIGDLFESIKLHYYNHWKTGEASADIEYESEILKSEIEKLEEYAILAKSVGTVITIKSLFEKKINPKKCVFFGCPFKWNAENNPEFLRWVKSFSVPTLFIQQENDPFYSYKELERFLPNFEKCKHKLVKIDGANHAYDNYDEIKALVKEFITV